MKQDVIEDMPERPPRKRRQLEAVPDVWIAMWLAYGALTPSERRKLEEEKARRKAPSVRRVVGFTGTRAGLTPVQRDRVSALLAGADEGRHGDCVGGDETFHGLCLDAGIPVVLHPPEDARLRAHCRGALRVEPSKPFLERDKDIVRESTELIAAPKETREPSSTRGSGTWFTVRYARKRGAPVKIIMPNGELQGEST